MPQENQQTVKDLILENIDHVKLNDLKEKIGRHDYSTKLQKFIKSKTDRNYTPVHIRRSLSMKNLSVKFVLYAIEYCEELDTINQEQKKKEQTILQSVQKFLK